MLGELLGALLGETLGETLGEVLGAELGDVLGSALGDVLGAELGSLLGDVLGEALGDMLGAELGLELGDVVGTDVGSGVGLCDGTVHTIVRRTSSTPALAEDEINLTPNVKRSLANDVDGTVNVISVLSEPMLLSKVTSVSAKVPDLMPAAKKLPTSM